jgi:hypothetical protein
MAVKKRAEKLGSGAVAASKAARSNPYMQALIEDKELRGNLRTAYESASKAYKRMSNGKAPTKALMDDKKVQRELKDAAGSLREAADSLRGARPKKKRRGRRLFVVLLLGAGVAIALNEGMRERLLDLVFGAEEEFEYSSTTTGQSSEG